MSSYQLRVKVPSQRIELKGTPVFICLLPSSDAAVAAMQFELTRTAGTLSRSRLMKSNGDGAAEMYRGGWKPWKVQARYSNSH